LSEALWLPGLAVLFLGLVVGTFLVLRLRRPGRLTRREQEARDLALRVADLERRRDDLYRRLQDETEPLTPVGRDEMEKAAARTLHQLDEAQEALGKTRGREKIKGAREESPRKETAGGSFSRHPSIVGFALGAGMVAVVAALAYWAVRDAVPERGTPTSPPVAGSEGPVHPEDLNLPPEARAEYEALWERLQAEPTDLMARKRLALLLLANNEFFGAYREAEQVLAAAPDDIDALYVMGVVRLQMGQGDEALVLLDRVLELFPDHVRALAWKGILYYQSGEMSQAIATWERGIEAAGGSHPELEQMVSEAVRTEAGVDEEGVGALLAPAAPAPQESPPPESGYRLRIYVAPGSTAPPTAILFVSLRPEPGGTPLAVKRIARPVFPLEVFLDSRDAMTEGAVLPESGTLSVRLDADGSASTRSETDLTGEVEAVLGGENEMVLGR
jgi:tetratricopeptide (TPR) repeat protein